MGTDQREENKQDGSERLDARGAAATTAGAVRVCNQQIQPRPLKNWDPKSHELGSIIDKWGRSISTSFTGVHGCLEGRAIARP